MRRLIWTCAALCVALVSCDTTEPNPGSGPGLDVTLDPPMFDTLAVNVGSTNVATLGFEKDSLATVGFTATGPAGTTVTVSPAASGPGSAGGLLNVSVTAASGASPQTGTVTVFANTLGTLATTTFAVRVQPAPAKSLLAFRICNTLFTTVVTSIRYQNEGGAWQSATEDARGLVQISTTPRLAIAYEWTIQSVGFAMTTTRVIYATRAELAEITCPEAKGTKTFPIKTANAFGYAASINGFKAPASFGGGAVTGPLDLFATSTIEPRRAIVRRGVNIPDRDTIALDFAAPEVAVLDSSTLTVTSLGGDTGATGLDGNGADVLVLSPTTVHRVFKHSAPTGPTSGVPSYYFALPSSSLTPADIHALMVQVGAARGIVHWFRTAAPKTLDMGPAIAMATGNATTGSMTFASQPEYGDVAGARFLTASFSQSMSSSTWYAEVWVTKNYLGGTPPVWRFRMPDFATTFEGVPIATAGGMAAGGRASLVFGARGADGETLRWAASGSPFTGVPFPAFRGVLGR